MGTTFIGVQYHCDVPGCDVSETAPTVPDGWVVVDLKPGLMQSTEKEKKYVCPQCRPKVLWALGMK